ncbi:MAG TPA: hypothetical protein VFY93_19435 [Planctomycetota bacterium]|nr:hypothetical protein [Planctomycetota bacterium]
MRILLLVLAVAPAAFAGEFFNDKVAALDEFPREVERGKTLTLQGACRGAYKTPELVLIAPAGKTYMNEQAEISGPSFKFLVRFEEGPGPYRLELIARTNDATRSAARFTIYYGVAKPAVEPEEPPPAGPRTPSAIHTDVLEKRFQRLLNTFRVSIGCEPVGWNEAVAARAREHAEHMAEASRRQHRFGGKGVLEMLGEDGAGPGGLAGPAGPWPRLDSVRPFAPPTPGVTGNKVRNHVVVQNVCGDSMEELFERHFVREAAFRICAADPHCVEVAVGAARIPTAPPVTGKPPPAGSSTVYYCVCFVQVNEKPLIRGQDDAFDALLRRGKDRDPAVLRALGRWGRPKAERLLDAALDDPRPEVSAAAFDGLLVLDEEKARAEFARRTAPKRNALDGGRYADAAALFAPYRGCLNDRGIANMWAEVAREAQAAARHELVGIVDGPEAERPAKVADLKRRVRGLGMDDQIDKALAAR